MVFDNTQISGFGYARQHSETQMTTSRGKVNLNTLMSPEVKACSIIIAANLSMSNFGSL